MFIPWAVKLKAQTRARSILAALSRRPTGLLSCLHSEIRCHRVISLPTPELRISLQICLLLLLRIHHNPFLFQREGHRHRRTAALVLRLPLVAKNKNPPGAHLRDLLCGVQPTSGRKVDDLKMPQNAGILRTCCLPMAIGKNGMMKQPKEERADTALSA